MKIALMSDYYYPFNPGGAEWSTHYLADSFQRQGVEVIVVTPNYGASDEEVINGIKVIRFHTSFKVKDSRSVINPILQNNPMFFLRSWLKITKVIKEEGVDLIHVNGKFLIPGGFLAARQLKKPFVVSIRDKQLLCSYGRCFFEKNRFKACGWWEYLISDRQWFFNHYIQNKNLYTYLYTFPAAIWTRMMNGVIAFFAKRADQVIAISKSQKDYLDKNGFKNVMVIYNSITFSKVSIKRREGILYAGKLSLGKGIYELLRAVPMVLNNHNEQFVFAGGIDEKDQIKESIKSEQIEKNIKLLSGVDHFKLRELYASSKLVVMPSIFPEAFGRVALEALAAGTPVVVADRGGLPEIVKDGVTGRVSDVAPADLAQSINQILDNLDRYLGNVKKERSQLVKKFEVEPIKQYINLYKRILKASPKDELSGSAYKRLVK